MESEKDLFGGFYRRFIVVSRRNQISAFPVFPLHRQTQQRKNSEFDIQIMISASAFIVEFQLWKLIDKTPILSLISGSLQRALL